MKVSNLRLAILALGLSSVAGATGISISSGNTTAIVNDQNRINGVNGAATGNAANPGQLYSVTAFGYQIYDVMDAVHDFGYMVNGNTGTFGTDYIGNAGASTPTTGHNTTSGGYANSPTNSIITTTGTFTGSGLNMSWTRTYTFTAANVLQEVFTVQNNSGSSVTNFQGFAAYDPDTYAGGVSNTVSSNSILSGANGYTYAQAVFSTVFPANPYLYAVLASNSPGISIGFTPTPSMTAACVNALTGVSSAGCDLSLVNGTSADRSYAYAFMIASLGAGASQSFIVNHVFADTANGLSTTLAGLFGSSSSSSSSGGGEVPEPGSLALMGSACVALGVIARRRAKK